MPTPKLLSLALLIALAAGGPAGAAEPPLPAEAREPFRGQPPPDRAERLTGALTGLLGLNQAQSARLRSLLQDQEAAHQAEREAHQRQVRARDQATRRQVAEMLDERQRALYDAFMLGLEVGRPPHPQAGPGQHPRAEAPNP
jgi:hypothetical protein